MSVWPPSHVSSGCALSGGLKYTILNTELGWLGLMASARGLCCLTLPQPSAPVARRLLGDRVSQATRSPGLFGNLAKRLRAYFSGCQVVFADELDLSGATPFQCQVWQVTRCIPCGETRSYLWVAGQMGRPGAVRAVGQALGRNPLPVIVPCHRVVGRDGRLGGYRGGTEMKQHLLHLEASGRNDKLNTVKQFR